MIYVRLWAVRPGGDIQMSDLPGASVFLFLAGFLAAKLLLPYLFSMLTHERALKKNWFGKLIPGMAGIVFPLIITLVSIPLAVAGPGKTNFLLYLFAVFGAALLGFVDDMLGDSDPKGLKGHFYYFWRQKKCSTGLLKALGSGVIAVWIVLYLKSENIVVDWLLLLLTINLINLMDLRPGRALKVIILIFILALFLPLDDYRLLAITAGVILAYLRYDLQGMVMLGDSGSNTLGMIAGLVLLEAPVMIKAVLVILLALLHAAAEKYSFSRVIDDNRWLKKIDGWGRK